MKLLVELDGLEKKCAAFAWIAVERQRRAEHERRSGLDRSALGDLERPPSEVARMFVARLRAGSKIVDAKAVHHFTSQRLALWPVLLLLAAGVAAVAVSIAVTPVGNDWFDSLGDRLADLGTWIKGLFS